MENQLQSLSKIFTEKIFRIPDYQRGFAWTEKQLKDFWNDIIQLEDGHNHYVGVLTLEDVPPAIYKTWSDDIWIIESKSYSPHYIVDGQQRTTTSILLIQAILETVDKEKKLNYTKIEEIQKRFIFDSKDEEISRSYIFGYERDNPSYNFLKIKIFNEKPGANYNIEETIYTHNLEFAKKYFKEKLEKLSIEDIEKIYKKITQNLLFNIYSISSEIDVFVTFETMNNRGKPLSHLELLKNRLIYLSTRFDSPDYEKDKLRKTINESWAAIYHYLGKNKDNPLVDDKFLLNHFIIYFGHEILEEKCNYEMELHNWEYQSEFKTYLLESVFTSKNLSAKQNEKPLTLNFVYDYVNSLKISVETWYNIFNPYDNLYFSKDEKYWLEKLLRLGIDGFAPLIMVFLQKESDVKNRIKLLKKLEQLGFIYSLWHSSYRYLSNTLEFGVIPIKLTKDKYNYDKILKSIDEIIEKLSKRVELIKDLKERFKESGYYNWRMIKYFLFEYDLFLQEKSKTKREKINWDDFIKEQEDFITVEHIYPQRPKKNSDWIDLYKDFSQSERAILKNSLGNLLPLSKPKNSSLGNKTFKEKIGDNTSTIGYRYGCYSENELTFYDKWTAECILKRGIKLLEFLESRWGINLGDENAKVEILNLSFVKK